MVGKLSIHWRVGINLSIGHSRKCHFVLKSRKYHFGAVSRKCHFVPESGVSQKMPPCSRMSMPPCSRTETCHFIPELVIVISRMSFLLSLHFPEFEIVQNDILDQKLFALKCHFAPESAIYYLWTNKCKHPHEDNSSFD